MQEINFFGATNFRNTERKFGIKIDDRRRHFYVVGKTGMGKTEMLKNMAVQDIQNGYGMGFVDPHGEAVEELLDFVPASRAKDVIYFNPSDLQHPIAFNVMEHVAAEERHMVASGLMSVFKKIWPDVWSARMEYILNNVILALLESPNTTLLGINRVLSDPEYRAHIIEQVQDPVVKAFWTQEYAKYTQRYEVEATAAIQNKVGQFSSNPLIRNIIGQERSSVNMRKVMDESKILLVNISKGRIGEDNSRLLGGLLVTKLQLAAMSRVDMPEDQRSDFFLFLDEFQHFATESFVSILSEARKYRLALILSHQYIAQLGTGAEATVRDAVFGNVGTIVSFRVGAEDAEVLEKEFTPEFLQGDFVNLGKYTIYIKLMIDGVASRPFSASTLPPVSPLQESQKENIIELSREAYSTPLQEVADRISEWTRGVSNSSAGESALPHAAVPSASLSEGEQALYDARCSSCGKDTKVIFEPDGKRPVYCKSCRKKLRQAQDAAKEEKSSESQSREDQVSSLPPVSTPLSADVPKKEETSPVGSPVEKYEEKAQEPQQEQNERPQVSLQNALQKEPVLFHPQKKQPSARVAVLDEKKKKDKEDLQGILRKVLEQTKKNPPAREEEKQAQEGVLEPGKTIYFDQA
jgi:CxxC-x17-CxxC domain-containing protein